MIVSAMILAEYTPHILTGASLFLSIFIHWKAPRGYWKPSFVSAGLTALLALLLIFVLQDNYLNIDSDAVLKTDWSLPIAAVAGLGFCYGLIIALLIGYVMKVAPSFFD